MFLSFVTACFTMAASWVPNKQTSFYCMVMQCLVYTVASYFYGVYATIPVMLLSALRNWLIAEDRFTPKMCAVFCVVVTVLGLAANNAGITGLITIFATIQITLCGTFFKGLIASKRTILVNLLLWVVYDILIRDYFSLAMDAISSVLAIAAILRIRRAGADTAEKPGSGT